MNQQIQLQRDLSRLFRSMDFASRHTALKRDTKEATRFAAIYQPPYTHFVSELPRRLLRKFPVMLQFDQRNRFTGLVIFKPAEEARRLRKR